MAEWGNRDACDLPVEFGVGGRQGLEFGLAGGTACPFGQAATLLSPSVGITIGTGQIQSGLNQQDRCSRRHNPSHEHRSHGERAFRAYKAPMPQLLKCIAGQLDASERFLRT
jgi:hypothetical protein